MALDTDTMAAASSVRRIVTVPPLAPGFGGEGHMASLVVAPQHFVEQDPFVLLADDHVDLAPGKSLGGAHPHAGFEIVTYALSGHLDEGAEGHLFEGDLQFTTAGSGVVHGEQFRTHGPTRILQLWVALPAERQWTTPGVSVMRRAQAEPISGEGVSGRHYRLRTPSEQGHTVVPVTLSDMYLQPHARHEAFVPAQDRVFVYVLDGAVTMGSDLVRAGQVAWLSAADGGGERAVAMEAGADGARVVVYSAPAHGGDVVLHGSFVGRTPSDVSRMFRSFVGGEFARAATLPVREIRAGG